MAFFPPSLTSPDLSGASESGASWLLADDEDLSFLDEEGSVGTPSPQKTVRKVSQFIDDPFTTPPLSPTKRRHPPRDALMTPEKVTGMKRKIEELDPDSYLSAREQREIEDGLDTLQTLSDTPQKKKRSTEARNLHNMFVQKATQGADGVVEKHDQLVEALKVSPFYGRLLATLTDIDESCAHPAEHLPQPMVPVNYRHIVEPVVHSAGKFGKAVGWHFCTQEQYPMLSNIVYSTSGVFSASFRAEGTGHEKRSTFFPLSVPSVEVLDQYIQSSVKLADQGVRSLCFSPDLHLFYETIKKDGSIHSAYPLLYMAQWGEDAEFSIFVEKPAISSEQILEAATSVIREYAEAGPFSTLANPVRYFSEDHSQIYVDIGPAFENALGVTHGVLFAFDRELFKEFEEHFDEITVDK